MSSVLEECWLCFGFVIKIKACSETKFCIYFQKDVCSLFQVATKRQVSDCFSVAHIIIIDNYIFDFNDCNISQ